MPSDLTAPTLTSVAPVAAISPTANLTLQFSEAIALGGGAIYLTDGETQSYIGRDGLVHTRIVGASDTRALTSDELLASGSTLTINPSSHLHANTQYRLVFSPNAVVDSAGNPFAGLTDSSQFRITTGAMPDLTPPSLLSLTLADNTLDQGTTTTLTIKFSEAVQSISLDNFYVQGGELSNLTTSDNITWHATLTPSEPMSYHYIWFHSSTLTDVAGNATEISGTVDFAVDQDDLSFNFYDGSGPRSGLSINSHTGSLHIMPAVDLGPQETLRVTFGSTIYTPEVHLTEGSSYYLIEDLALADSGSFTAEILRADGSVRFGITKNYVVDEEHPDFAMDGVTLRLVNDTGEESDGTTKVVNPTIEVDLHSMTGLKVGDRIAIHELEWYEDESSGPGEMLGVHEVTATDLAGNGKIQIQIEAGYAGSVTEVELVAVLAEDAAGNLNASDNWYSEESLVVRIDNEPAYATSVEANGARTELVLYFSEELSQWGRLKIINNTTLAEVTITAGNISVDGETGAMTALLPSALAADDSYSIVALDSIEDLAGNELTGEIAVYQPPISAVIDSAMTLSDDTGSSGSDGVTAHAAQTISGTFTGVLHAWEHIAVQLGNGPEGTAQVTGNSWTYDSVLVEGHNQVKVWVVSEDDETDVVSHDFTLDTNGIELSGPLVWSAHTGSVTGDTTPTIRLAFTGDGGLRAGDEVQLLDADHQVVTAFTINASDVDTYGGLTLNLDYTSPALSEGSYSFTTRVVDLAGNVGSESSVLSFTVDTTAPLMVANSPANAGTALPNASISVQFSENIDFSGATFSLTNGTDTQVYTAADLQTNFNNSTHTLTLAPQHAMSTGTVYHLTWTGQFADLVGNVFAGANTLFGFTVDVPA